MNIGLIGYGKIGKEIEQVALSRNHSIPLIIDINNLHEFNRQNLQKVDVAIEFTQPESAVTNIRTCFTAGIPVVCGTTGWSDHFEVIKKECLEGGHTLFYASNYSLGMNIFFKLNRWLATIMNNFPQYGVEIVETHHTEKLDGPSGTAISLAKDMISVLNRKKQWQLNNQGYEDDLKITAIRKNNIPGIHSITYESSVDFIEITHSAKNRQGLALGAVLAAEFIAGKKGVYAMDDLLAL